MIRRFGMLLLGIALAVIPAAACSEVYWEDIIRELQVSGVFEAEDAVARREGSTVTISGIGDAAAVRCKYLDGSISVIELSPYTIEGVSRYVFEHVAVDAHKVSLHNQDWSKFVGYQPIELVVAGDAAIYGTICTDRTIDLQWREGSDSN